MDGQNAFETYRAQIFAQLGEAKIMALATGAGDIITARNMSCILHDGAVFFQTDKKTRKFRQMRENPRVALCADNIQIEGIASELGHPMDEGNGFFRERFEKHYKGSFDAYSALADEVLMRVRITNVILWGYENKQPFRIFLDMGTQLCKKENYEG